MTQIELQELLGRIQNIHVGIIGDFCLDAYFMLNESASEISLETGLPTRPVKVQRYSLGGAGNVASNLSALGVKTISVFGVVGRDPFGRELQELLTRQGIHTSGLFVQDKTWDTHCYVKPYNNNKESNRIDFGNFNELNAETASQLFSSINSALPGIDIMIINQQVLRGIHCESFRNTLKSLIQNNPQKLFLVDSRHHSDTYDGALRKINTFEAMRLCGKRELAADYLTSEEIRNTALYLYSRWQKPLFISRGEHGCAVIDTEGYHEISGLLLTSPTDSVGAGDSMVAGIAAALATGVTPTVAAEFGSFVAGVTVQKLFQTGTASPEDVLAIGSEPNYRYQPELARQPHKALFHPGTEIELVHSLPPSQHVTHCIFDHDGTISTLRQGWEEIMAPMMMRAILGTKAHEVDEAFYNEVQGFIQDFIDKTTGVQTLVQMKGLIDLVHQFNCVPESDILDEHGYKQIYNEELLRMVNGRIAKLNAGELDVTDFTVKNAIPFLRTLYNRGIQLYLASGTDIDDVTREAETMGYRDLFGGRIYGATGDAAKDAKKIVLERILGDIGQASSARVLTFGDGPVEIRETHKKGGYTVGVASNEIRRYGINTDKRRRLIEAGANLIIPDYSQMNQLLALLFSGF